MATRIWGITVDSTGALTLPLVAGAGEQVTITDTFVSGQGVTNSGDLNSQQMLVDHSTRTIKDGNVVNDSPTDRVLSFTGNFQVNRAYTVTIIASAGTFTNADGVGNNVGVFYNNVPPYHTESITSSGTTITVFTSNAFPLIAPYIINTANGTLGWVFSPMPGQ